MLGSFVSERLARESGSHFNLGLRYEAQNQYPGLARLWPPRFVAGLGARCYRNDNAENSRSVDRAGFEFSTIALRLANTPEPRCATTASFSSNT